MGSASTDLEVFGLGVWLLEVAREEDIKEGWNVAKVEEI
jgi:hypothetical protein